MKISISQPAYLPWLGYFDRILKSDAAIVLDSVMLERSSKTRFTNRNKIRNEKNWSWLTVPVQTSGLGQPLIRDVLVDNEQRWAIKHLRSLQHAYSKAPFFEPHSIWLENFYQTKWDKLSDLLDESTAYLVKCLDIKTPMISSSDMRVNGQKADLILNICKEMSATTYISGPFGREYLDLKAFEKEGIEVVFHDYSHPVYDQVYPGFEPFMSTIDLIFNHGGESLKILES